MRVHLVFRWSLVRSSGSAIFFRGDWYNGIISTANLSLPLIQGRQLSVAGERMWTKYWLTGLGLSLHRKGLVRLNDHLDITIVVDWDV